MTDINKTKGVSLIIPVYNEVQAVRSVLEKLIGMTERLECPFELIVVNDGSTDGTLEILESFGDSIKVFHHSRNRGYGAALKTGISHSSYPVIAITDADGTYPGEQIIDLIDEYNDKKLDMAVGARVGRNIKIPLVRKPAKWFISRLANYLTGTKIPDLNSGLRVMKKEIVQEFLYLLPDGFSFTTTITLAMLTRGYNVEYIKIDYDHRIGKSKIRPVKDTMNFIQLILRTTLYFNPLRIFIPFSFFLVLFAFIFLFGSWMLFGKPMDVTFGVILMTAAIVLAIGMLADLIDKKITR